MIELSDRETLDKISKVAALTGPSSIKAMNEVEDIIIHWRSNKIDSAYPTLDGCCKFVDIAADLQRRLDKSELTLDRARTTCNGAIKYLRGVCDTRDKTIEVLEAELSEKRATIDYITGRRADEVDTLYALKDELSTRKKDSAALSKVVDIIMNESVDNVRATLLVAEVVDDYLDVPEDTPIDEPNEITVKIAWLELP